MVTEERNALNDAADSHRSTTQEFRQSQKLHRGENSPFFIDLPSNRSFARGSWSALLLAFRSSTLLVTVALALVLIAVVLTGTMRGYERVVEQALDRATQDSREIAFDLDRLLRDMRSIAQSVALRGERVIAGQRSTWSDLATDFVIASDDYLDPKTLEVVSRMGDRLLAVPMVPGPAPSDVLARPYFDALIGEQVTEYIEVQPGLSADSTEPVTAQAPIPESGFGQIAYMRPIQGADDVPAALVRVEVIPKTLVNQVRDRRQSRAVCISLFGPADARSVIGGQPSKGTGIYVGGGRGQSDWPTVGLKWFRTGCDNEDRTNFRSWYSELPIRPALTPGADLSGSGYADGPIQDEVVLDRLASDRGIGVRAQLAEFPFAVTVFQERYDVLADWRIQAFGDVLVALSILIGVALLALMAGRRTQQTLRTQHVLDVQNSMMQAIMSASPNGILVTDDRDGIRFRNNRMNRMWHLPVDGLSPSAHSVFEQIWDMLDDGTRDGPAGYVLTADSAHVPPGGSWDLGLRDGRRIEVRFRPVRMESGSALGRVWFFNEITERVRAENALSDQLKFQKALMDTIPSPFFYLDNNARYLGCNQSYADLIGMRETEMIGRTAFDVLPSDTALRAWEKDMELLRTGGQSHYETVLRLADGQMHYLSVAKGTFHAVDGSIRGLVGVLSDVSDLRKTATDLQRSNEDLEQFAYVASHDLQEPLRMVSSYLGLLQRRYGGQLDQDADDFIRYAVEGAHRMHSLIMDLLQYSRVGTRGKDLEPVESGPCLDAALTNLALSISEAQAEITVQPELPLVMADPWQLTGLFQNLISNAVKYRDPDRPVKIEISAVTEPGADFVRFTVQDNGIGIDPQYTDRVFLLFQRLQTRDLHEGTGIGLAVSKKIVERHGGVISLQSKPGEGSAFSFTLQRAKPLPSSKQVA